MEHSSSNSGLTCTRAALISSLEYTISTVCASSMDAYRSSASFIALIPLRACCCLPFFFLEPVCADYEVEVEDLDCCSSRDAGFLPFLTRSIASFSEESLKRLIMSSIIYLEQMKPTVSSSFTVTGTVLKRPSFVI